MTSNVAASGIGERQFESVGICPAIFDDAFASSVSRRTSYRQPVSAMTTGTSIRSRPSPAVVTCIGITGVAGRHRRFSTSISSHDDARRQQPLFMHYFIAYLRPHSSCATAMAWRDHAPVYDTKTAERPGASLLAWPDADYLLSVTRLTQVVRLVSNASPFRHFSPIDNKYRQAQRNRQLSAAGVCLPRRTRVCRHHSRPARDA